MSRADAEETVVQLLPTPTCLGLYLGFNASEIEIEIEKAEGSGRKEREESVSELMQHAHSPPTPKPYNVEATKKNLHDQMHDQTSKHDQANA